MNVTRTCDGIFLKFASRGILEIAHMNILNRLLFSCLTMYALTAHAQTTDLCPAVFEQAEQEKEAIPTAQSARRVAGEGRLYFHTAPDKQCQSGNVFVVANDRLEAYAEHGEFTEVIYWNSRSRAGTAGWVVSSRLTETASGPRSGPVPAIMSSNSLR
jgi:hypothetical protein